MNLQEEEGNGFHSFQTRLPWSEACWLVCRMGEAPRQRDAWSSRRTGVDVRWRGSESGW